MKQNTPELIKYEFYALCLLSFSLPIIEVSKNLACVLLLLFFTIRTFKQKENLLNNTFGNIILLFVLGSVISAIGVTLNGYDAGKIRDIIRYGLVGWMLLYIPLSNKNIYTLLGLLLISTIIGVIGAQLGLILEIEESFELRSVGHSNHSAIYILLIIGALIPFLIAKSVPKLARVILTLITAYLTLALFQANSRAAILALAIITLTLLIYLLFTNKKLGFILITLVVMSSIYIIIDPPKVIKKIKTHPVVFTENELTGREKLWITALHAWKKESTFGIGYGNYSIITPEQLHQWYPHSTINFHDEKRFHYSSHSHNRFINTLTEGGIIGLLSLLILLTGTAVYFWKSKKTLRHRNISTAFWFLGINTLISINIVGIFNTTIHHEHGLLTMILLGLAINYLNKRELTNET